jgi:hypothetical protein
MDQTGMPGYVYTRGQYSYFILHKEVIDGKHTGCYLKEHVSKEQYDKVRGKGNVKAKKARL